jgi:hypothetical protein
MDGKNATLLTPEDATHEIGLSDSGEYFVDSYSTPPIHRLPCSAAQPAS